ncbi:MAG: DUF1707 domain-containing protein [Nocardioides sp.]
MTETSAWDEFELDPRRAENAAMRASDGDREVVHRALASSFAAGQLDQEEFEARTELAVRAKTLGELPPLLADLIPDSPTAGLDLRYPDQRRAVGIPVGPLHAQALAAYRKDVREAMWGFVSASVVTWVIWLLFTRDTIPWPLFVMLGTGLNVGRLLFLRHDQIAAEERRLERKQAKRLGPGGSLPLIRHHLADPAESPARSGRTSARSGRCSTRSSGRCSTSTGRAEHHEALGARIAPRVA